jgi:uncharacterized membrane-anchored protein YhcB (DUF1043 family)
MNPVWIAFTVGLFFGFIIGIIVICIVNDVHE